MLGRELRERKNCCGGARGGRRLPLAGEAIVGAEEGGLWVYVRVEVLVRPRWCLGRGVGGFLCPCSLHFSLLLSIVS